MKQAFEAVLTAPRFNMNALYGAMGGNLTYVSGEFLVNKSNTTYW